MAKDAEETQEEAKGEQAEVRPRPTSTLPPRARCVAVEAARTHRAPSTGLQAERENAAQKEDVAGLMDSMKGETELRQQAQKSLQDVVANQPEN